TRRRTAQRAQGITGCHLRSGQSVDLGLPHLSGAHAGRPSGSDGATARCYATRGANRAARAREVLRLARRRAKGAVQPAIPHSGLTPRNRRPRRKTPFIPAVHRFAASLGAIGYITAAAAGAHRRTSEPARARSLPPPTPPPRPRGDQFGTTRVWASGTLSFA